MFDNLTTEQLLNMCGHTYDAACLYHAKHDAAYKNALNLLLNIVDELARREKMLTLNKSQYEHLIRNYADAAAYELHREKAQFWLNPETLETKIIHVDKGTPFPPFTKNGWIEIYASEINRISLDGMLRSALKRNNITVKA